MNGKLDTRVLQRADGRWKSANLTTSSAPKRLMMNH